MNNTPSNEDYLNLLHTNGVSKIKLNEAQILMNEYRDAWLHRMEGNRVLSEIYQSLIFTNMGIKLSRKNKS